MNNAIRRKKLGTRYIRRKRRRHIFPLFVLTVTAVSAVVVSACIFSESETGHKILSAVGTAFDGGATRESEAQSTAEERLADEDIKGALSEMAKADGRYETLLQNIDSYPQDLLELAVKNIEAVDFVLAYPENKDSEPAKTADEVTAGTAVQFLQWDKRWGYAHYGDSFLAVSGCGPTALAMAAAGLTGDNTITPYTVARYAEDNGYYVDGVGSSWSLISEGCRHFGLTATELSLSADSIYEALSAGKPVICSVRPGDFTTTGHFIVIYGTQDGQLKIYDPNSRIRSEQLWDYERVAGQINNLWAMALT